MNSQASVNAQPSQAAIGRVLGLAPSTITKYKWLGMPLNSVESARTWHKAHTNIAKRKPRPARVRLAIKPTANAGAPVDSVGADDSLAMIGANEAKFDGAPTGEDFDAARTREKIATANLAEIEESALRGTYLNKADFERYLFNAGRMLRDTLTNCARRIGAEVAGLATADACEAVIDREHRAALAGYASLLRQTLKIEVDNPLAKPVETEKKQA